MNFKTWLEGYNDYAPTGMPHFTAPTYSFSPSPEPPELIPVNKTTQKKNRQSDKKRIRAIDKDRRHEPKINKRKQRKEEIPLTDKEKSIIKQHNNQEKRAAALADSW